MPQLYGRIRRFRSQTSKLSSWLCWNRTREHVAVLNQKLEYGIRFGQHTPLQFPLFNKILSLNPKVKENTRSTKHCQAPLALEVEQGMNRIVTQVPQQPGAMAPGGVHHLTPSETNKNDPPAPWSWWIMNLCTNLFNRIWSEIGWLPQMQFQCESDGTTIGFSGSSPMPWSKHGMNVVWSCIPEWEPLWWIYKYNIIYIYNHVVGKFLVAPWLSIY